MATTAGRKIAALNAPGNGSVEGMIFQLLPTSHGCQSEKRHPKSEKAKGQDKFPMSPEG
jgi:hypothetical protein